MRGKEIITKLIIPGAIAMIICLIVHPMCMNGEILDWRNYCFLWEYLSESRKCFCWSFQEMWGQGKCLVWWYLN